jgi:hypothetical protein
MAGLTNKYVENLSKIFLGDSFLGVYPIDVIPHTKKKTFSVIFNLSKHYEPGSHFIAIIKRYNEIIYFDSFGKKCNDLGLLKFMKKFRVKITFNTKQLQHEDSNFCGYYCFYFIYFCSYNNKTLRQLIAKFSLIELKQNDHMLISYIVKDIKSQ